MSFLTTPSLGMNFTQNIGFCQIAYDFQSQNVPFDRFGNNRKFSVIDYSKPGNRLYEHSDGSIRMCPKSPGYVFGEKVLSPIIDKIAYMWEKANEIAKSLPGSNLKLPGMVGACKSIHYIEDEQTEESKYKIITRILNNTCEIKTKLSDKSECISKRVSLYQDLENIDSEICNINKLITSNSLDILQEVNDQSTKQNLYFAIGTIISGSAFLITIGFGIAGCYYAIKSNKKTKSIEKEIAIIKLQNETLIQQNKELKEQRQSFSSSSISS